MSAKQTRCKEIDELSERLRRIYYTETIRIVEDVEVTVNIIEKIVGSITTYNIGKAPDVGCFFVKVLWQAYQTNLSPNSPKYFRILNFLSFSICSLRFIVDFWVVLLKKDVPKAFASILVWLLHQHLWTTVDGYSLKLGRYVWVKFSNSYPLVLRESNVRNLSSKNALSH